MYKTKSAYNYGRLVTNNHGVSLSYYLLVPDGGMCVCVCMYVYIYIYIYIYIYTETLWTVF
jgi:hypothetical protein